MKLFRHHVYEYEKGLRHLILHTTGKNFEQYVCNHLERKNIDYIIQDVTSKKINVYFGNPNCINVIKTIGNKNPSDYTDEEDFMLGIMLGYDQIKQCKRYIDRKKMGKKR